MVTEQWRGVFTVEYDDVDMDQLAIQCGFKPSEVGFRLALRTEAGIRAAKACPWLHIERIEVEDTHAKVIYSTNPEAGRRSSGLRE